MDHLHLQILGVPFGLFIGAVLGFFLRKRFVENHQKNIGAQGKQIIENALIEAEQLKKETLLQCKEEAYQIKQDAEKELKEDRDELKDEARQLNKKRTS